MPTISQLPLANSVSAADEVLISQGGTTRATLVGSLLASTQPAIIVDPSSLIGRISVGSGGPEQVDVGIGIKISGGTLVANGSDHAVFPVTPSLSAESDLVISNQGSPMLMPTSLLRGLFSAGTNVNIDSNGVISATGTINATIEAGSSISHLQVVTALAAQDLVAVSNSGLDYAITYNDLLDGVTIDQAEHAGAAADSDTIWVAQGSNIMSSQTFSSIWTWIANKLPSYKVPIVELTTSINLDAIEHNGRLLVCSQPISVSPALSAMGSGFQCTMINASGGNVTLGAGFVSSTGSLVLAPWQSATLSCVTYSGGTIAFAVMPALASVTAMQGLPPQVTGLTVTPTTSSMMQLSWLGQSGTNAATSYTIQYRVTGSSGWTSVITGMAGTSSSITGLQAATSYDFVVIGINSVGAGAAAPTVTAVTAAAATAVSSVTWNLVPSGTYPQGSGATIGVNAQVSPANSAIQFGFSLSSTTPPSSWTAGLHVNTNLWGAYPPTPPSTGTWYAWAEGLDGSAPTVYPTPFLVQ